MNFENNDREKSSIPINDLIKIGEVTSVNYTKLTARVTFDDDGLTSYELPILQRNTYKNHDYCGVDVGEDVICLFLPSGTEEGFILGTIYAGEVSPPQSNGDVREVEFSDGTILKYDRGTHKLTADVKGSVDVKATGKIDVESDTSINLKAPIVNIRGLLNVYDASGGSAGVMEMAGRVHVTGTITGDSDITAGTISLQQHVHGGVQTGQDSTSTPT